MAVINNKKQEQQVSPYTGMVGVSGNTAQQLAKAQTGYKAGDAVNAAQQTWQQIQNQKPGAYASRYTDVLNNILNQIQNPQEFKYEFNGDNLFKGYADLYNQYAKQGMMDAMGNAAALTGGYGNSYAQMVGQQQYQQNMLPLYEKGMELYDRAYQKYRDNQSDLYNQYGVISGQENTDYSRYRDLMGDWTNQEAQAYNRYQDAQNFDYTQYQNDLNYWTGLAQVENQAYQTEQQRLEAIRQYNQDFAESKRRYDQEWEHQLALEAAAAAAEEAGGGPGRRSSSLYYRSGNTYYKVDENGRYQPVDPSTIPDSARVDETTIDSKVQSKISQANSTNPQSAAARTATNQTADKKKRAQLSY